MPDLTNAAAIIKEFVRCAVCQRPVDRVRIENDPVLLRYRLVVECHGKFESVPQSDGRYLAFVENGATAARGDVPQAEVYCFQPRGGL